MDAILRDNEVRLLIESDTTSIRVVTDLLYLMYQERYGEENVAGYSYFEDEVDKYVRRGRTYLLSEDRGFIILYPNGSKLTSKRLHEWVILEFYLHPEVRDTTLAYRALNWILQTMQPEERVIGVTEMGGSSYFGCMDRFPIKSVTFVFKERG